MQETGAKTFYLPSADYIWPHVLNESARQVVRRTARAAGRRAVLGQGEHRRGRLGHVKLEAESSEQVAG